MGARVSVQFSVRGAGQRMYPGFVSGFDAEEGEHVVEFDDGEVHKLELDDPSTVWRLEARRPRPGDPPSQIAAAIKGAEMAMKAERAGGAATEGASTASATITPADDMEEVVMEEVVMEEVVEEEPVMEEAVMEEAAVEEAAVEEAAVAVEATVVQVRTLEGAAVLDEDNVEDEEISEDGAAIVEQFAATTNHPAVEAVSGQTPPAPVTSAPTSRAAAKPSAPVAAPSPPVGTPPVATAFCASDPRLFRRLPFTVDMADATLSHWSPLRGDEWVGDSWELDCSTMNVDEATDGADCGSLRCRITDGELIDNVTNALLLLMRWERSAELQDSLGSESLPASFHQMSEDELFEGKFNRDSFAQARGRLPPLFESQRLLLLVESAIPSEHVNKAWGNERPAWLRHVRQLLRTKNLPSELRDAQSDGTLLALLLRQFAQRLKLDAAIRPGGGFDFRAWCARLEALVGESRRADAAALEGGAGSPGGRASRPSRQRPARGGAETSPGADASSQMAWASLDGWTSLMRDLCAALAAFAT